MFFAILAIPFSKPIDRSAQAVLEIIEDFINDEGGPYDWDDFISIKISDPQLENIRKQAANIHLPLTEEGCETLKYLRSKVKNLI